MSDNSKNNDKIEHDLLSHIFISRGFHLWMGFLTLLLGICLYAYTIQLHKGLGVTGLRDYTTWECIFPILFFLLLAV